MLGWLLMAFAGIENVNSQRRVPRTYLKVD